MLEMKSLCLSGSTLIPTGTLILILRHSMATDGRGLVNRDILHHVSSGVTFDTMCFYTSGITFSVLLSSI
jgi:hypothetical protein